jgi:hypothetical protein
MTKRQMPDLSKLLSATATPMPDAAEPLPPEHPASRDRPDTSALVVEPRARVRQAGSATAGDEAATANLENLNFKVPKSFRKRFRDCAYRADLKHNELLFAALDAWESLHGKKN